MPFKKYRTVEEMLPPWMDFPPSPDNLARRIRSLWARSHQLANHKLPKGVRKYRTPEEADFDRKLILGQTFSASKPGREG